MIIGSFNGWNIVQLPAHPAPRTQQFTAMDVVGAYTGVFSGQQQFFDWQSGWLEVQIALPPLTHTQAQPWIAFLMELRGVANCFQIGDALAVSPQGSAGGSPAVSGAGQNGYTLATNGWPAGAINVLLPGDWIQIGYRLYRNLDPVNSDGSGNATLNIWPRLRESPPNGALLTLTNTTGLFRLKANPRQWSIVENRTYGMQFEAREAI